MKEPDIRVFFKRIIAGSFAVFLWMLINVTAGIKFNYAFWSNQTILGNIVFYIWLLISGIILFLFIKKLWKKPM